MACIVTKGRTEPCKDVVGGINAVYFADYDSLGTITYDGTNGDVVDAFGGTPTWFKYVVKVHHHLSKLLIHLEKMELFSMSKH